MAHQPLTLTYRPATLADAEASADLGNRFDRHFIGEEPHTGPLVRKWWDQEGMDIEHNTQMAFNGEGRAMGAVELSDYRAPHVRKHLMIAVDPALFESGLGERLLDWGLERARARVGLAPEGARVVLQSWADERNDWSRGLFESRGFHVVRRFYRMVTEFDGPPPAAELPEGIQIRPITPGQEREVYQAVQDTFRDHWGFIEEPVKEGFPRWLKRVQADPDYDPTMFYLAWEGDRVAGVATTFPRMPEHPGMGWVWNLGVRRPWRGRGLGMALLRHCLAGFYARGCTWGGLGVDAQNLTGALRLYEKAGMHADQVEFTYELVLRDGDELTTQAIESD